MDDGRIINKKTTTTVRAAWASLHRFDDIALATLLRTWKSTLVLSASTKWLRSLVLTGLATAIAESPLGRARPYGMKKWGIRIKKLI